MGSLGVVLVAEPVEQGMQLSEGGRLPALAGQPGLKGLLEAFDLAAGGGVVGAGVLLGDPEHGELGLERVAAAAPVG